MELGDLEWPLLIVVAILDVVGWWIALLLWVIPTLSIDLGEILSLSIWSIVGIILFFVVWMPLMIAGNVFLIGITFA